VSGLLAGRSVLLTGATSVLGREFARAMCDAGATVALVARREHELDALVGDLAAGAVHGSEGRAVAVTADLNDLSSLPAVIDRVRAAIGPIDTLINAAGRGSSEAATERETLAQITGTLTVNLVAPLVLAQLVLPDMRTGGSGCVVNVGSIAGEVGIGRIPQASYAASKGGLHALTRELAAYWSRFGIRVNCLAPGFFRSEMTAELFDHPKSEQWIARNEMLPRHAEAADLVGALMFLVSDASATMTGQILLIDNGWTAR
jgi:NAD(P)-dependent dehydrogenase (short-subunit alcohol dehydrogenase family)